MATVASFTRKHQNWQKDKIKLQNCETKNGRGSSKCSGELRREQQSFAQAKVEATELHSKGKLPSEFAAPFGLVEKVRPAMTRQSSPETTSTFEPTTEAQQAEILALTAAGEDPSDSSSKIPFIVGGVVLAGLSLLGIARWRKLI
jgi:hypothetical protein